MKNVFFLLSFAFFTLTLNSCNDCKDVVCNNGGICEDGTCDCPNGFSGASCEIEDLCITQDVTCLDDGVCADGECDCKPNYRGESCQTYCVNGTFNSTNNSCNCWPGWEADGCTTESRLDWIGTYSLSSNCNQTGSNETIEAMEHPDADSVNIGVNYVKITGLTTIGDKNGYGLIDGNSLRIPRQNVSAGGVSYRVESQQPAILNGNSFELIIIRTYQGNDVICTLSFEKA